VSASLQSLIPELIPAAYDLLNVASDAGLQPRVTSTRRSYAEQKRLYNRFLAGQSQYPAAPPGKSAHEFGYAFDVVVSPMDYLPALGDEWIQAGGVWHASDPIHFEYPGFVAVSAEQDVGADLGLFQPVAEGAKTIIEWMNELPWYASLFLPMQYTLGENKITRTELKRIFGI